ncbi:DUF3000 domain-containing protein [Streptomyces sp. NPDC057638]|uniref:DUF3000 domain-containing protein n=1 Tax=Streptomyces sp. NPDC057638 TaxID=3346190 RepID=UPI003690BFAB
MAAAQGHFSDHPDHSVGASGASGADPSDSTEGREGDGVPRPFRLAVEALRTARPRPGVEVDPTRPPRKLAPYAYALEAVVVDADGEDGEGGQGEEGQELADGRLILLHDPAGHDAWQGTFRLVTLVRAELEPEMAADPLLPEVCWSWLTGALEARGLAYGEPSGTVTRAGSHYFGGLAERRPATQIEIRASWTPQPGRDGVPDTAGHLAAWCDLLCQTGGVPPVSAEPSGPAVVTLPQRRGPHPR